MSKGHLFALILALILLSARPSAAPAAEVVDRIVAVVNGEIITLFELNERLKPVLDRFRGRELGSEEKAAILKIKQQILQQMVDDILLTQQAAHYQLTISDAKVETEILTVRNRNNLTEEQFLEQLKLEGTTREDFAQRLRRDILKHRLLSFMVRSKVMVTEEEIGAYFEQHRSDYVRDKRIGLGLIVLPPGMPALELKRRIKAGELDFAQAAGIYSQGPGANQGGDIGVLAWESLAPEWKDALRDVAEGGVSDPLEIRGSEALLMVRSLEAGEVQPLEEVHGAIYDTIYRVKLEERFNEYMEKLRAEALIDIRL